MVRGRASWIGANRPEGIADVQTEVAGGGTYTRRSTTVIRPAFRENFRYIHTEQQQHSDDCSGHETSVLGPRSPNCARQVAPSFRPCLLCSLLPLLQITVSWPEAFSGFQFSSPPISENSPPSMTIKKTSQWNSSDVVLRAKNKLTFLQDCLTK